MKSLEYDEIVRDEMLRIAQTKNKDNAESVRKVLWILAGFLTEE
jgi:hypothetical protein